MLTGDKESQFFLIDQFVAPLNKAIAVTGVLSLYGPAPTTTWTRLYQPGRASDTQIEVTSAEGWLDGDEIVIGPTEMVATEFEQFTITGSPVNNGDSWTVTLDKAI